MTHTYDLTTSLPSGVTRTGGTFTAGVGVSITGSPPSFTISDETLLQERDPNQWLIIRMSSPSAQFGGVYFNDVEQEYSFPIRGDGKIHTYNVWLGDNYIVPRTQSDVEAAIDPAKTNEFYENEYKLVLQDHRLAIPIATTMTLSALTGSNITITAGAATFAANSVGRQISSGAGKALITAYTSATVVTADVTSDFADLTIASKVASFWGFLSSMRVYPSFDNPGGSGVVEWAKIAAAPEGPAMLVIEHVGPARALMRVNQPCRWGIRVRNCGAVSASGFTLSFSDLSPSLTVDTTDIFLEGNRIPVDESRTFYFWVTSAVASSSMPPAADTARYLTVTVTCAQGDSATKRNRMYVYPAAPTGLTAGVVPAPIVTAKPYTVMCWYFSGWGKRLNQYVSIAATFENRPELGFFDQSEVRTIDWEIKWAVEHGIDVFLFEWIDNGTVGNVPICTESLTALLAAPNRTHIKFAISYINTVSGDRGNSNPKTPITAIARAPLSTDGVDNQFFVDTTNNRLYGPKTAGAWPTSYITCPTAWQAFTAPAPNPNKKYIGAVNFLDLIRVWKVYFESALYYTHDGGKYYVDIYSPPRLYSALNNSEPYSTAGDNWMAAVMARAVEVAGGAGLSWSGLFPNGSDGARFYTIGFRRSSAYGWGAFTNPQNVHTPNAANLFPVNTFWSKQTQHGFLPNLPLWNGFDHRLWSDPRNTDTTVQSNSNLITHGGFSFEDWRAQLVSAKAWLDERPELGKEILICSWNEWGERSNVGPQGRTGFASLEAIRQVFAPDSPVPTIVGPSDIADMAIPHTPNLWRWVASPCAYPAEDGNTHARQGVTIPLGSSSAIEPARSIGCWMKLG